jgi:dipeptidase D
MKTILIIIFLIILIKTKEEIRNLNPKEFWNHFYDISQIPHCKKTIYKNKGSKKESLFRNYLSNFAKSNNYIFRIDDYGNSVMDIPATRGKENKPKIVLQSHLDVLFSNKFSDGLRKNW